MRTIGDRKMPQSTSFVQWGIQQRLCGFLNRSGKGMLSEKAIRYFGHSYECKCWIVWILAEKFVSKQFHTLLIPAFKKNTQQNTYFRFAFFDREECSEKFFDGDAPAVQESLRKHILKFSEYARCKSVSRPE